MAFLTSFQQRSRTAFALCLGVFFIATWLFWEYPELFSHIRDAIPLSNLNSKNALFLKLFRGGDPFQTFYLGWKLKENLVHASSIFHDPYLFSLPGWRFLDMHLGIQHWIQALLMFFIEPIVAYNLGFIVLPLFLTFLGSFLLFHTLSQKIPISWLSALCFALLPYRLVQLFIGHGAGHALWLLPFYVLFLLRFKKGLSQRLWPAGLCLILLALSDEHLIFYTCLISFFVVSTWWIEETWGHFFGLKAHVEFLKKYKALALSAAICGVYLGFLATQVMPREKPENHGGIEALQSFSKSPDIFFSLDPHYGIGVIALVGVFFLVFFSWKDLLYSPHKTVWLGFLGALPILIFLMSGTGDHWIQRAGVYDFFYTYIPLFSFQRFPFKASIFVSFLTLILGNALAQKSFSKKIMCLFFVFQLWFQLKSIHDGLGSLFLQKLILDEDGYRKITSTTKPDDVILALPIPFDMEPYATKTLLHVWKTGRRFASGYHTFPPTHAKEFSQTLRSFFSRAETWKDLARKAKKNGYTHVLLDTREIAGEEGQLLQETLTLWSQKIFCSSELCFYQINK